MGSVYIPCETSVYHDGCIYETLLCDMLDLYAKFDLPFVIMGDFNSRTSTKSDILPIESHVTLSTGYTDDHTDYMEQLNLSNRANQDKVLNKNGKGLISLCQTMNLRILNGRFGLDKGVGGFTCHTSNGDSTVDYIIVSDNLIPRVSDFFIDPHDNTLSDVHSAISMSLFSDSDTHHHSSTENIDEQLADSVEVI